MPNKLRQAGPVNPTHYRNHPSGIECIQVTEHLPFCPGNAIKYIWRHASQPTPESQIEDLQKAIWYINRTIDLIRSGR